MERWKHQDHCQWAEELLHDSEVETFKGHKYKLSINSHLNAGSTKTFASELTFVTCIRSTAQHNIAALIEIREIIAWLVRKCSSNIEPWFTNRKLSLHLSTPPIPPVQCVKWRVVELDVHTGQHDSYFHPCRSRTKRPWRICSYLLPS